MMDGVLLGITEFKKDKKSYESEMLIPNGKASDVELIMRMTFNIVRVEKEDEA